MTLLHRLKCAVSAFSLTERDVVVLRAVLMQEVLRHNRIMKKYAKNGFLGMSFRKKTEAFEIMRIREKFQLKR